VLSPFFVFVAVWRHFTGRPHPGMEWSGHSVWVQSQSRLAPTIWD